MNLLLRNHQSVGDIIMLTACVRDLKRWYPEINIGVNTSCDTLFENNPYLSSFKVGGDLIDIKMEYPVIHKLFERDVHFLHGFIEFINEKLSLRVKLTEFKGDIHLTDEEKAWNPIGEPYWVMVAGGKPDFPAKIWRADSWQKVVNNVKKYRIVTIGGRESTHIHPHLDGVIDMVGKTTIRQSLSLIYNSCGVVSPITYAMHAAACFDKPAVVVAGGREHWYWEKYWGHTFLHTIGLLDCCRNAGCWKNECENTTLEGHQKCLELINPIEVAEAIDG